MDWQESGKTNIQEVVMVWFTSGNTGFSASSTRSIENS